MNKKRFGSLSVRHWAMIFALAALTERGLRDAKRRLGADGGDDDARAAGV